LAGSLPASASCRNPSAPLSVWNQFLPVIARQPWRSTLQHAPGDLRSNTGGEIGGISCLHDGSRLLQLHMLVSVPLQPVRSGQPSAPGSSKQGCSNREQRVVANLNAQHECHGEAAQG
jgi:hypothetical protein